MHLNTCNFIKRIEQVLVELDISTIELCYYILVLPLVARCLETIDVCIWHKSLYVYCIDCLWVCGSVGMFVV